MTAAGVSQGRSGQTSVDGDAATGGVVVGAGFDVDGVDAAHRYGDGWGGGETSADVGGLDLSVSVASLNPCGHGGHGRVGV